MSTPAPQTSSFEECQNRATIRDVGSSAQWLQITFIGGILAWIAALAVRVRS